MAYYEGAFRTTPLKILVLGADGYIGWPLSLFLSAQGHHVICVDNESRRYIATEHNCDPLFPNPPFLERVQQAQALFPGSNLVALHGDLTQKDFVDSIFKDAEIEVVIHLAEQPSAPFSMRGYTESHYTLHNNLITTHNILWSIVSHCPRAHLVKLGTMGEYGTPNIDIEEGWLDITHNGRSDRFLYPRAAGSIYHTTKVLDTDLIYFFVRNFGITVTDLMQGPVYGLHYGDEFSDPICLPNFHYDGIFGTVINRFITQCVANHPLTIYGKGGQTRGYLHLTDSLQCINLAILNPPSNELRILNQFVDTLSVNTIADIVVSAASQLNLPCHIKHIENPRKEKEEHYYNAKNQKFYELGLSPLHFSVDSVAPIIDQVIQYKHLIDSSKILPSISWNPTSNA